MALASIPGFYVDEATGKYFRIPLQGIPEKHKKVRAIEPDLKSNNALRNFRFLNLMGSRYNHLNNDLSDLESMFMKDVSSMDMQYPSIVSYLETRNEVVYSDLNCGRSERAYYYRDDNNMVMWDDWRSESPAEPECVGNELISVKTCGSLIVSTYMGKADKPPVIVLRLFDEVHDTMDDTTGSRNDGMYSILLRHHKSTDSVFCSDVVYNQMAIGLGRWDAEGKIPYLASGGSKSICMYERTETDLYGLTRSIPTNSAVLGLSFYVTNVNQTHSVILAGQRNGLLLRLDSRMPENNRIASCNKSITNLKFLSEKGSSGPCSSPYFIMSGLGDSLGLYDMRHLKSNTDAPMNPVKKFSGYYNPVHTHHVLEVRENSNTGDTILAVGSGCGSRSSINNGISLYNVWGSNEGCPINKFTASSPDDRIISCTWAPSDAGELFFFSDSSGMVHVVD